nr:TPA_inf: a3.2 [Pseudozyma tsukubaensis]
MFSIFNQATTQTSVAETPAKPQDQGRSHSGIGYSSCVVA